MLERVIFLIYITGDTHADFSRFSGKIFRKLTSDDYLIICGDFGFIWDEGRKQKEFLKKIGNFKFNVLFVDGTHENFDLLEKYNVVDFHMARARHICGRLYHLLRGQVYKINEKSIFTFGGGESLDKELKSIENKWWGQETPTINEMKLAVSNLDKVGRKVDYVITHEPPGRLKTLICGDFANINTLNRFFDDVAKEVNFKKWFFGSLHKNREITEKYVSLFDEVFPIN